MSTSPSKGLVSLALDKSEQDIWLDAWQLEHQLYSFAQLSVIEPQQQRDQFEQGCLRFAYSQMLDAVFGGYYSPVNNGYQYSVFKNTVLARFLLASGRTFFNGELIFQANKITTQLIQLVNFQDANAETEINDYSNVIFNPDDLPMRFNGKTLAQLLSQDEQRLLFALINNEKYYSIDDKVDCFELDHFETDSLGTDGFETEGFQPDRDYLIGFVRNLKSAALKSDIEFKQAQSLEHGILQKLATHKSAKLNLGIKSPQTGLTDQCELLNLLIDVKLWVGNDDADKTMAHLAKNLIRQFNQCATSTSHTANQIYQLGYVLLRYCQLEFAPLLVKQIQQKIILLPPPSTPRGQFYRLTILTILHRLAKIDLTIDADNLATQLDDENPQRLSAPITVSLANNMIQYQSLLSQIRAQYNPYHFIYRTNERHH